MKKVVALVLAVMLALSFAACGGEKVSNNGDVTVTWLVPGDKQADIAAVVEAANKITMEKLGVKFNLMYIDTAAYTQRMNMNFASGNSDFDICFTGYVNPYKEAVIRGAYLPIDEYIEKSDVIKKEIPQYGFDCARINGEVYGLPNMQIMATSCTGLFVQEDLAEEYGLKTDEIKTLEDIEPFLAWVKETHPELYPFRTGRTSGGTKHHRINLDGIAGGVGVVHNEDGTMSFETALDDVPYANEEAELMRSWFEKGYIRADVASAGDDTSEQAAGKFAVWRGVYKPGAAAEHNANNPNNRAIEFQISQAKVPFNAGSTAMTAINAASNHPEEAFKVIELANSDAEFMNILAYGIEGKHYNLDENGQAVLIPDSGYNSGGAWKFGSVFNSHTVPGQALDVWEQTKAFNEAAYKSPLMGFSFDTTPVRTEIGQISTVSSKYKQGTTGAEPMESWRPNYLEEFKEAGVEKVKAEVEKQVTQWMEANK